METAIQTLSNNYDLEIDNPIIQEAYEFVKNNKNENVKNLLQKYYRPTSLKMGTVGAYLWGSLQNYYGDVNKSCSILNNNSLFNVDETCQYQMWTYKGGELECKGHSLSSKAYIYVDEDWKGFSLSSIEKLVTEGIEHAAILNTVDSKHRILIKMSPVDTLPIIQQVEKPSVQKGDEKSFLPYYIFFLIFVIIFVKIYYKNIIS